MKKNRNYESYQDRSYYDKDDYEDDYPYEQDYIQVPQRSYERKYKNRKNKSSYDYEISKEQTPNVAYVNNYNVRKSHVGKEYDVNTNDYYDNDDYSEREGFVSKKSTTMEQLLVIIQIIACTVILLGVLGLKSINNEYYYKFAEWYNTEINKTLIAEQGLEHFNIIEKITSVQETAQKDSVETYNAEGKSITVGTRISRPLNVGTITSTFNEKREDGSTHKGLDIAASCDAPVSSVLPGTVTEVSEDSSYGKYLIIEHENNMRTLYAHCNNVIASKGDNVDNSSIIAYVGSTGDSTGYHLHLELTVNGENYDPRPLLTEDYV